MIITVFTKTYFALDLTSVVILFRGFIRDRNVVATLKSNSEIIIFIRWCLLVMIWFIMLLRLTKMNSITFSNIHTFRNFILMFIIWAILYLVLVAKFLMRTRCRKKCSLCCICLFFIQIKRIPLWIKYWRYE